MGKEQEASLSRFHGTISLFIQELSLFQTLMDLRDAKYLLIDLFVLCKSDYGSLVVHKEI